MSTFKIISSSLILFCIVNTINVVATENIELYPSHVNYYIDSNDIGKEFSIPVNFSFIFSNLTNTSNVNVFLSNNTDINSFRLKTHTDKNENTTWINATLFINMSSDVFTKKNSWNFFVIGEITGGMYNQQLISKVTIYKNIAMNIFYFIVGFCSISLLMVSGYVLISGEKRRRKQHEKN